MKLLIQIPAYNEADTIGEVIDGLPRTIPGVDVVEVLVIDDGCRDATVATALAHGADHIVRHTANKGLAVAYQTGIDECLRLGADIIVNTDGDNQYPGASIPQLIAPILAGQADIVIGDRQIGMIEHFSPFKKALQQVGSWVVRRASSTDIPDTVSGFRALSREAALRTFVTSDFSYTVESLIQAGRRRLTLRTVKVTPRPTRPSKLHRGNWNFVKRQAATIVRTYATYEPFKAFSYIAAFFLVPSLLLLIRAAYIFVGRRLNWFPESLDNTQAALAGGVLLVLAVVTFLIGLLADLVGRNRRIQEELLYRSRRQSLELQGELQALRTRLGQLEQALGSADPLLNQARGAHKQGDDG
jgi:glycosyltransferase involved in cell wall biosynthesis